jgi:hypothetical protein
VVNLRDRNGDLPRLKDVSDKQHQVRDLHIL